jgi:hypothetical protein
VRVRSCLCVPASPIPSASSQLHSPTFPPFPIPLQFHNPAACWHRDSMYVYVSAVGGQVWVFHVGSSRVVCKLKAHKINVRDLCYDTASNLLATCSFDKTVKVRGLPD